MYQDGERSDILKLSILESIKSSRALLREWIQMAKDYPEHASQYREFAAHEQMMIERDVDELIALKKRRAREAIEYEKVLAAKRAELEARYQKTVDEALAKKERVNSEQG